jgi:hypothetical protein
MDHIRKGTLVFRPKLGLISADNQKLLDELGSIHPCAVSWSNVVDYLSPKEFHTIAKQISGPDTVHFFHTCNWHTRVYGTDIFDIHKDARLHIFTVGLMAMRGSHPIFDRICDNAPFHFRDLCTLVLARDLVNNFLRYFFEGVRVCCGGKEVTPLNVVYPFDRSLGTAHLAFAYHETGITFGS